MAKSCRMRKGGRSYVGGKKRTVSKKHHKRSNKTRKHTRKGSKKHAKRRTHRRRHRGGNLSGFLGKAIDGLFGETVTGPLQQILGDDKARAALKAEAKKIQDAQVGVGASVQKGYKGANKAAASIVNKPGSGSSVAVLQQMANSSPQVRGAYPSYSLNRP